MTEFSIGGPAFRVGVRIEVMPPCAAHGPSPCSCPRSRSHVYENPNDTPCVAMLETIGFAAYFGYNLGRFTGTLIDIGSVNVGSVAIGPQSPPFILAGTVSTAPTFQDWHLGGQVPGASGSIEAGLQQFTTAQPTAGTVVQLLGNIQNLSGATITYTEVGLAMQFNSYPLGVPDSFLLTHDTFTGTIVPPNGVLAVTYDFSLC